MLRDIEIECLEIPTYSKITKGYVSGQDTKITTTLYYAISGINKTNVVISEDANKLRQKCIANTLKYWMPPNTIISSSSSELVFKGKECHINLYDVVKDPSVNEIVQHLKNILFNTEEVRNDFAMGLKAKKPCYYFDSFEVLGCTVQKALQHPDKVIDSWVYWRIVDDYDNRASILDKDGNDVTEDIIPSSTQKFVKAICSTDDYDVYSIKLSKCDIHFY